MQKLKQVTARWLRGNPGTLLVVVLPLLLLAAGLSGAVGGSRIDLRSGAAWLGSAQGQIILVSGSAARRVAAFPVSAPGQDLSLVQTPDAVFIVNRTTSTVTRMDAATFRVTPPFGVPGSGGRLQVLNGGRRLYVLDGQTGVVQTLDPITMELLDPPRSLDIQVDKGGAVIDAGGRIWAVDAGSGAVRWLDESSVGTGMTVAAGTALVVAGGAAVAISGGRAHWLSSAGQSDAEVDLGALAGEVPTVSGAPDGRLLVAIAARALVKTCGRGGCDSAIGRLSGAGSRFGPPQLLGDVVLVPDVERGTIHLVRPGQGAEFAAPTVMPPETDFEIVVHEGFAFYNAVGNEWAGVLRITGDFTPVQKYQPEDPNQGLDTPDTLIPSSEVPRTSSAAPSTVSPTPTVIRTTTATVTTVRPTRTTSVPATSRPAAVQLVIQVRGAGRVTNDLGDPECSGTGPERTCTYSVEAGRTVNLTAVPAGTDRIAWTGLNCPNPTCAVAVATNMTVTATFSAQPAATPVITDLGCTPANPVGGEAVSCTANESTAGSAASWIWQVRNAATGTEVVPPTTLQAGQPFIFTPASPGSFTVQLTVRNGALEASATSPVLSKIVLPDLRGETSARALDALRALGLTPATESQRSHAAPGTVLGTDPATVVNWGQPVTVLVSSGPNAPVALGDLAPAAQWSNGNGVRLPWPGDEGDSRGFARPAGGFGLASGSTAPANAFETHPEWISGGQISGRFRLPNAILSGDRLTGAMDFRAAAGGGVRFWVSRVSDGGGLQPLGAALTVEAGSVVPFDVDLSAAAGETALVLTVDANGDSAQDWAIWVNPVIQ